MPDNNSERRRQRRFPVRVPVSISSSLPGTQTSGCTRDLSMTGMFLYADSQFQPGSELEIVLILPPQLTHGERRWVCCQASVVRVENKGDMNGYGVAASIQKMEFLPELPG
jgi:hypothetical protein